MQFWDLAGPVWVSTISTSVETEFNHFWTILGKIPIPQNSSKYQILRLRNSWWLKCWLKVVQFTVKIVVEIVVKIFSVFHHSFSFHFIQNIRYDQMRISDPPNFHQNWRRILTIEVLQSFPLPIRGQLKHSSGKLTPYGLWVRPCWWSHLKFWRGIEMNQKKRSRTES